MTDPVNAFRPLGRAHILYNFALGTALLALSPLWIPWAMLSGKRRKNFPDRLGWRMGPVPPPSGRNRIWMHAVSVGETISAAPLVRRLRALLPGAEILFSTVTITGQETAKKSLGKEIDAQFYFPFDLPGIAGKFLDRLQPDIVVIFETEIWPNFLAECSGRGIPAMIVNGRISERSFAGYKRFRFLFSRVLACMAAITAQTHEDARRFLALGAVPASVSVTGNMKFDVAPPAEGRSPLHALLKEGSEAKTKWFVAGSTHEGEEAAALHAFGKAREIDGSWKLLLAPRHPERFDSIEELCRREGFETIRRTRIPKDGPAKLPSVILLDTVGELSMAYAAADLAFVGGSLVPKGGHNILEPALYGVPTVVGPHMENFREIAEIFTDAGALRRVRNASELSSLLERFAADPIAESGTGKRARELLAAFRGATDRNAAIVERLLSLRRRKTG